MSSHIFPTGLSTCDVCRKGEETHVDEQTSSELGFIIAGLFANELTGLSRGLLATLADELAGLEARLHELDHQLVAVCRQSELSRRVSSVPGFGPVIATALVASIGDGRRFKNGRELAAWIGLVPRQRSSGGKIRLVGIGKRAHRYLRIS